MLTELESRHSTFKSNNDQQTSTDKYFMSHLQCGRNCGEITHNRTDKKADQFYYCTIIYRYIQYNIAIYV